MPVVNSDLKVNQIQQDCLKNSPLRPFLLQNDYVTFCSYLPGPSLSLHMNCVHVRGHRVHALVGGGDGAHVLTLLMSR